MDKARKQQSRKNRDVLPAANEFFKGCFVQMSSRRPENGAAVTRPERDGEIVPIVRLSKNHRFHVPSLVSGGPSEGESLQTEEPSRESENIQLETVSGIGASFMVETFEGSSLGGHLDDPNLKSGGESTILGEPSTVSQSMKRRPVGVHKLSNHGTLKRKRGN